MDYGMLRQSMRRIVGELLPPDFVFTLGGAILAHKDTLSKNFPDIVEELKPAFKAGMIETGAGIFDMDELEAEIFKFLRDDMGMTPELLAAMQSGEALPEAPPADTVKP